MSNPLATSLCQATLFVGISGGPFKIIGGRSFYHHEDRALYDAGEVRSQKFTIELRPKPRPKMLRQLRLIVSFSGFGQVDSAKEVRERVVFGNFDTVLNVEVGEDKN